MGLFGFGKKHDGGVMDAINADGMGNHIVWQWRPKGQDLDTSNKANAIRMGSGLLVNDGQAAMFLYPNSNQSDVILGYHNDTIDSRTGNYPILANIIGAAYDGSTPFQARIYFVSMEGGMQVNFSTEGFVETRPSQPNLSMYTVKVAVSGSLMFSCVPTDMQLDFLYKQAQQNGSQMTYEEFRDTTLKEAVRKIFRMCKGQNTTLDMLQDKIKDTIKTELIDRVANIPDGIFVLHLNKLTKQFSQYIYEQIYPIMRDSIGIWPTRMNITDIRFDESTDEFQMLKRITTGQSFNISMQNEENLLSQLATDAAVRNGMVARQAEIQMDHQEDMMARMREEAQFAQHTQTESTAHRTDLASETAYLGAHTVNVQGAVMQTGMENIGNMGTMDFGAGDNMNPAGMMMGMGMAAGMAGQMGQMMSNMGNAFNAQVAKAGAPTPPPMPGQTPPAPTTPQAPAFYVLNNNQQMGPYDMNTLRQLAASGMLNAQTMVWTQGMPQWDAAGRVSTLAPLFQAPQQTPPMPPTPGSMPPPPPAM